MVFTLEDLFTELEKFYYYSIHLRKKGEGEMLEKPYECLVTISLSEGGARHTRAFNEISLGDLFQSMEGFIEEMIIKKKGHRYE